MVDLTNIGTLFAFVLVSAGVIVLRRIEPDRVRPFRAPWVPLTPIISIVTCLYLMLQLPTLTWIRFGIWLLLGLVIYFFYGDAAQPAGQAAAEAAERRSAELRRWPQASTALLGQPACAPGHRQSHRRVHRRSMAQPAPRVSRARTLRRSGPSATAARR